MYCTQVIGKCSMLDLYGGDKFIQIKNLDNFNKGKEVKEFMKLGEPAYGFFAIDLKTGSFRFDADGEVIKAI